MAERDARERDILVAGNEYAYVQDLTKGDIVLYVGPTKISLSNTERLVELRNDRFAPLRGEDAGAGVSPFVSATSSQYIVLENPPRDATVKALKGPNSAVELLVGRKIVVPGPAAFPLWPGQKARVVEGHARKMGLYLRVLRDFDAADGDRVPAGRYVAGQELFLEKPEGFFFPSDALEVLAEVHPIPLAENQGIYVRELATGRVHTIVGPRSFLPDPTQWERVPRELDDGTQLRYGLVDHDPWLAVTLSIPPSHAVLVTGPRRREVVQGPTTLVLDYDESLEVLTLSTGKPKTDEHLIETCSLQVEGNKVSDQVRVRTADHVELALTLSYRVSFVGTGAERARWFNVKDYVGLLCDHLGSIVRAAVRAVPVDVFHARSADVVRSAILGEKQAGSERAGRRFEENNMWVYDVEVLDLRILDADVHRLLGDAQRAAITSEIGRKHEEQRLKDEQVRQAVNREIYEAELATIARQLELEAGRAALERARAEGKLAAQRLDRVERARAEAEALEVATQAEVARLARLAELDAQRLAGQVSAFREQMAALQPELIATLRTLGQQKLAGELSANLAPLAILGGGSVAEVAERLLRGVPLAHGAIAALAQPPTNGDTTGKSRKA